MFRGQPELTGVAATDLSDTLVVLWRFNRDEGFVSSAAIVDGVVYVGGDSGNLYALDLADGSVKWTYPTGSMIESSPLVRGGVVYFGDDDGVFHAVDAATGTRRWTFTTDAQIISSPNHIGDRIVFGSYDGNLYCLSPAGKPVWTCTTKDRLHATPGVTRVATGDKTGQAFCLIAGCDQNLHVVDTATGDQLRGVDMHSVSGAAAAIHGRHVYVGTYGNQVLCIDWLTGRIVWTYENPDRQFPYMSSAALTGDLVILGGRDKRVRALDAATGKQRWAFVTRSRVDSSPVVVGDSVFVGSSDGNLYRLKVNDGSEQWRFDAASPITASVAVAAGRLVVGTTGGVLYCFGDPALKKAAAGRTTIQESPGNERTKP